jgi:hypothetical protein
MSLDAVRLKWNSRFPARRSRSGRPSRQAPPLRFAYEEPDWSPNAPPLGTEFIVEARDGGVCVARLVHSLFASSDEWDDQFQGFETGWISFFKVLRLYLTHFQGQRCSPIRVMGQASGAEPEAWKELTGALGLAGATVGERRTTSAGAPPLAGVVEGTGEGKQVHELLLRLDEPAPGIALLGVGAWGGKVHTAISFYLFGDRAPAAAHDEPLWHAWMNEHFPAVAEVSPVA